VLWPAFNNQNLKLAKKGTFWTVVFPTQVGRVRVPLALTERQALLIERVGADLKQGVARLYEKRGRPHLAMSVTIPIAPCAGTKVAGIDLGLRNLTVASCGGETLFFNGDHAAYVRRHMSNLRRLMGEAKSLRAIRRMKDKEARWMKDLDHKISRRIVNWCIAREVGSIRMEDLSGIRLRGERDRKDRWRSLHAWSFYRLQRYIAYKAALAGIRVEWVTATNTGRTCPTCGGVDKANRVGIRFECGRCGHRQHGDVAAANNISKAISGTAAA
jgi:IS605 OrfB family transposase